MQYATVLPCLGTLYPTRRDQLAIDWSLVLEPSGLAQVDFAHEAAARSSHGGSDIDESAIGERCGLARRVHRLPAGAPCCQYRCCQYPIRVTDDEVLLVTQSRDGDDRGKAAPVFATLPSSEMSWTPREALNTKASNPGQSAGRIHGSTRPRVPHLGRIVQIGRANPVHHLGDRIAQHALHAGGRNSE